MERREEQQLGEQRRGEQLLEMERREEQQLGEERRGEQQLEEERREEQQLGEERRGEQQMEEERREEQQMGEERREEQCLEVERMEYNQPANPLSSVIRFRSSRWVHTMRAFDEISFRDISRKLLRTDFRLLCESKGRISQFLKTGEDTKEKSFW
jgi:hypothetical protein